MQAILVMFRSDGERRSFSVTRDMTVIGRREDCDLRIPLHDISRKHARLVRDGDTLRLEDLGSSNGTYLNGTRVQEAILIAGDSVQVGPVVFVLQVDGSPADEDLRPITADITNQSAAPAVPGVAPLLPPVQSDAGDMGNEFATLDSLSMPDLGHDHDADAHGLNTHGKVGHGEDAHDEIPRESKDVTARSTHETDELEMVDVLPPEMRDGGGSLTEADMGLDLSPIEDDAPAMNAPPLPSVAAARMAPPPPLPTAAAVVPPLPPRMPSAMAPPPPLPKLSNGVVPPPPPPAGADDDFPPLAGSQGELDDMSLMDESSDSEMELADLTDLSELGEHSKSESLPPLEDHSNMAPLPLSADDSDLEPLSMAGDDSELESLPPLDDHSGLEPLPLSGGDSELESLAPLVEHSESAPLAPSGVHSAPPPLAPSDVQSHSAPLPMTGDHSEPEALHLSDAHSEPDLLPMLGDDSDLGELPLLGDDGDLDVVSEGGHHAGNEPINLDLGVDAPHRPHA